MKSRTIDPEALLALRFVRDAQLSPDGRYAAYAVSRCDGGKRQEYMEVFIQDLETGEQRNVAVGDTFASAPRWSPDGSQLAYTVSLASDARIYVYSLGTGGSRAVTPEGIHVAGAASWAPDGGRIAATVVTRTPPREVERITRRIFRTEGLGMLDHIEQQVHVFSTRGKESVQLLEGDGLCTSPKWAPTGENILVLVTTPTSAPGSGLSPQLCVVNAVTGKIRRFSQQWFIQSADWCPDGRRIVITGSYGGPDLVPTGGLWITDLEDATRDCRTGSLVPNVGIRGHHDMPIWDLTMLRGAAVPPGDFAYASVQSGGNVEIWRIALEGKLRGEPVISGERSCILLDASLSGSRLLYIASAMLDPGDLCVADWSVPGSERALTRLNGAILNEWPQLRCEHLNFSSTDGLPLEGWCLARQDANGPQPTVLYIHGGPFLTTGHIFRFDLLMLAANGYAVLFANFRGSIGYGDAFMRAIYGDWGARGFPDHMSTVDAAIARGLADPKRLGVWGASHGGFATCWIVGHTERFKAAVAEAAVTNFSTTYYLSDAPDGFARDLGGRPEEVPDVYRSRSPISYAHRCRTPTLLLHGMEDLRCTVAEAEQFYRALHDNGCTTEMVLLRGCNHLGDSIGPLSARVGQNEALLDWFERYL